MPARQEKEDRRDDRACLAGIRFRNKGSGLADDHRTRTDSEPYYREKHERKCLKRSYMKAREICPRLLDTNESETRLEKIQNLW